MEVRGGATTDGTLVLAEFSADRGLLVDARGTAYAVAIDASGQPRITATSEFPATVRDIAVSGSLAFALLNDSRVLRADLSRAMTWTDLGSVDAPATGVAVDGDFCYFTDAETGLVIARCNEESLTETARLRTPGAAYATQIVDNIAYIADGSIGLTLIDVSDRARPRLLGSNNKLGDVRAIRVDADRVYALNARAELIQVDVSRPQLPLVAARAHVTGALEDYAARDDQVWTVGANTLRQFDFSADATPLLSDEGVNLGGSRRGFVQGNVLFVADWFSGLHLYDIADPSAPRHIGNYHAPGSSKGVVVRDRYAFVADDDHGVQVVDIAAPESPVAVHNIPTTGLAYTMKLVDDRLYLADHRGGFSIIDVADPKLARVIGRFATPGKAWAVDVRDHVAYVADDQSGLLVLDVTDPAKIQLLGQYSPGGQAEDVRLHRGYAFVTFFDAGLHIVDISNPRAPRAVAQLPIPGNARGIDFKGNYAYIAAWEAGLQVVDIRDISHPAPAGYFDTDGSAWGVNIAGDHAWVLDWWGGIKSIDIRDPRRPVQTARYHARAPIADIVATDRFALTVGGDAGLQIYDVTNPLNPVWINGVEFTGQGSGLALDGATAYVATHRGLGIVDVSDPFTARAKALLPTAQPLKTARAENNAVAIITVEGLAAMVNVNTGDLHPLTTGALDLCINGGVTFVARGSLGLVAFTSRGLPAHLNTRWLKPVKSLRLLRSTPELAVAVDGPDRVRVLARNELELRERGQLQFGAPIRAIELTGTTLYVTTEDYRLHEVDLRDPAQPIVVADFVSTQPLGNLAARDRAVFVGGDTRIASLRRLPEVAFTARDASTFTATLPATLPTGSYDLVLRDGNAPPIRRHNAIRVTLKTGKKPDLSPERFQQLLQQQRSR